MVATVDLSRAYSRQLKPAGAVTRRLVANGTRLTVSDELSGVSNANVTWTVHTRAAVTVDGDGAELREPGGRRLRLQRQQPAATGACGAWRAVAVTLPVSDPPRFDVRGAAKLFFTCSPGTLGSISVVCLFTCVFAPRFVGALPLPPVMNLNVIFFHF